MLVVAALSLVIFAPKGGSGPGSSPSSGGRHLGHALSHGMCSLLVRSGVGPLVPGPPAPVAWCHGPTADRGRPVAVTALVWAAGRGCSGFIAGVPCGTVWWTPGECSFPSPPARGGALAIGGQVTSGVARRSWRWPQFRIFLGTGRRDRRRAKQGSPLSGERSFQRGANRYLEWR